LNEALRVIRRVAGEALQTDGDTIRIVPGRVVLDLEEEDAALSGGVLLEGFTVPDAPSFEDWVTGERERWRALSLERLVQAAGNAVAEGRLAAGRELAERGVALDPVHEPAVQILIRTLALAGARTSALQAYERFAARLQRDLGAAPATATADLAERIRTDRIVPGAAAAERTMEPAVPLVGAARDCLTSCLSVWRESLEGRPGVAIVRGEAGTGKSRVADEVSARARLDGAVVAVARLVQSDSTADVWAALIRGGLAVAELGGAAPEALAALAAIDPDVGVRFPASRGREPLALTEAIRHAASAVADARPLLLVLDDAHRAEQPLVDALLSVLSRTGSVRLCVLATATTSPTAVALDVLTERVGRDVHGEVTVTRQFDAEDISDLVSWAFPAYDDRQGARLVRRVLADTAGNPFLAVEYVRAVRGGLRVGDADMAAVWPAEMRTLEQTVPADLPETVAAALRLRFTGLSEDAQSVLVAAAVLGEGSACPLLARGADLALDRAEAALDELEWQRWLVSDARGYAFVTRRAREVVLADMVTAGRKRRIRERAASDGATNGTGGLA
jgi:hypothetical protein